MRATKQFSFHGAEADEQIMTLGALRRPPLPGRPQEMPRNSALPGPQAPPYRGQGERRHLGAISPATAAADAQQQMAALAVFFAGVNAGQSPTPAQLAAAMIAAAAIQSDLIAMGAAPTAATVNPSGGSRSFKPAALESRVCFWV